MKKITFLVLGIAILALLIGAGPGKVGCAWNSGSCGPYLMLATEDNLKWPGGVAYDSHHDTYLAVWETILSNGHHVIDGRLVNGSGLMSAEFVLYDGTNNSLQPAVVYDSTHDRYLVVWAYDSTGDGTDGDIYGRFIPWNGPSTSELAFGIDESRANDDKPKLAYSPTSDEFMIVYRSLPEDPDYQYAIVGGIIYHDKTGKSIAAISSGDEARDFPAIAYHLMRNEFVVTWDVDYGRGSQDLDVYARRLDYTGAPIGSEFVVANSTSNEQHPSVAACYAADEYLFVWQQQVNQSSDDNIFGRLMTGVGVLEQSYGLEGTTLPQQYPNVSCNPSGNLFFLTWQDMYAQPYPRVGIWGAIIQPNLQQFHPFEVIRPSDTRDRLYPQAAWGSSILVIWQHERENSGYLDIWGEVVWPFQAFLPLVWR